MAKLPSKEATHKVGDYGLVNKFLGYRAREDKTMLPLGTLIAPSQNVVINTSGRVAQVKGYKLDGTGSSVIDSGILSHYDFTNFKGDVRNLRAGFMTAAANDGKLQYRYLDASGTVNWVNLKTSLTNIRLSYCDYWDNTNLVKLCTWVDGSNNVFQWNGAVTTVLSATASAAGVISTVSSTPTAAGSGYAVGDILTITTGGTLGTVKVLTVDGSGTILTLSLLTPGLSGYTTGTGKATSGGAGTGATVNITAIKTASTVTKQGTNSWAQEGFKASSGSIVIGGVSATYNGAGSGTTLYGVDHDFSAVTAGSVVHQDVVTTALTSMTGITTTFGPTVVGCGQKNQLYLGASNSNSVYISKVNDFTNYSYTTPVRVAGEGFLLPIDAPAVKFIPQEDRTSLLATDMYISQGLNGWSVVEMLVSSDLTKETITNRRLKVAPLQGAKSERLAVKMKNEIVFAGNDNTLNFFGYQSYQYVPAIIDFSFPIIDDMNSYDLTDGSLFYHKNYIYLTVPKSGITRVYNMTDQTKQYTSYFRDIEDVTAQPWFWESPITYPVSGFYVTPDKGLCAHAYTVSESYQVFTGGNLNGQQIDVNATFSLDDKGDRTQSKGSDELWIEGYISQNTLLTATISGDLDGFMTSQSTVVNGNDGAIVSYGGGGHSLGESSLGDKSLGGTDTTNNTLPAWFHVAKTYPEVPFYLEELSFSSKGLDQQWELICFGTNAKFTPEGNNAITQ